MSTPRAKPHTTGVLVSLLIGSTAASQSVLHSTHDWPNYIANNAGTNDRAMDCKTPGDGRTYIVGTTFTNNTDPSIAPVLFSGATVIGPGNNFPFVRGHRQVAYLQIKGADQSLQLQRFFYGSTTQQTTGGFSTLARAISVFPAATPADTRIAICGETYDHTLPAGVTAPNPHTIPTTGFSPCSGFLAVYDGSAALLWSYQFYGGDVNATTMLTDLSIRVEGDVDLVTYCGNTTNGAFLGGPASTMQPRLPFAAPTAISGCTDVPTAGDTHNAPTPQTSTGQWDGFVGRLSMPHNGPFVLSATTRVFHSLVGGNFQDSLFGLFEIDANRFVVVGSTRNQPSQWGLTNVVPLWRPTPFNSTQPFCFNGSFQQFNCFGTVFWFDATATRSGADLVLTDSTLIGSPDTATVARDVVGSNERTWIVGSTIDPAFCSLDAVPIDGTLNDGTVSTAMDGFVLTHKSGNPTFEHATYLGGKDDDAMVGIAQWNEYPDHVAILGWTEDQGQADFVVHSVFANGYTHGQPYPPSALRLLRTVVHGGSDDEFPAHTTSLTTAGVIPSNVGTLEGGGVAVDAKGRVTIVGCTYSYDFPFDPLSPVERGPQPGRVPTPPDTDAVTALLDLLPARVCRTDGTGACNPAWAAAPSYQGDGGTTPSCATSQFGAVIGTTPQLRRMLIDFEGVPQAGSNVYVLLDRPTTGSLLQGSVMQVAFASTSPVVIDGIEKWMNDPSAVSQLYFTNYTSLRIPLGQLPTGANTFAIQFVCFLPAALCSTPNFLFGASPALMFSY